jgi:hypothetical protein
LNLAIDKEDKHQQGSGKNEEFQEEDREDGEDKWKMTEKMEKLDIC